MRQLFQFLRTLLLLSSVLYTFTVRASGWTEGGKKVLILDCGFSDTGPTSLTTQQVNDRFKLGQSGGLDARLRRDSFDRAWYDSVEHVKVTLPQNKAAYDGNAFAAYAAAMNIAGKVESDYDRIMVLAAGTVSGSTASAILAGRRSYYSKLESSGIIHHELFHNMGLGHANRWESSPEPRRADGSDVEYGDGNDVMGGGGPLNVVFKRQLDYLKEANGEIAQAVSGTTYRIFDHSNGDLSPAGTELRAVYIPIEGPDFQYDRQLWLSHTYEQGDEEMRNGLQIHAWRMNGSSIPHRLDMSPGDHLSSDANAAKADIQSAELAIGQTYTDTQISSDASHPGAISITPIAKGSTNGINWIDVVIYSESAGVNTAPHTPSISGPSTANAGASIALTASATDPDGDSLAYYWDFGDGTFSTDSAATQNKSWSTAGYYLVTVTISDRRGGSLSFEHWVIVGSQVARTPENDTSAGDLSYRYYEGLFTVLPNFNALLPVASGTLATVGIPPVARDDNFALEVTGYLDVPATDIYRLVLRSEDGSRLYFGDTLVIDNAGERNSPEDKEASIELEAGRHAFTVQMYHRSGNKTLSLKWATANQTPTEIPAGNLEGKDWQSNAAPSVSISTPAEAAEFNVGDTVTIDATATDSDGIERVLFFLNGVFIGEDATPPFTVDWTNAVFGSHEIKALAYDNTMRWSISATRTISVVSAFANMINVNIVGGADSHLMQPGDEAGAMLVGGNWNNVADDSDDIQMSYANLKNSQGTSTDVSLDFAAHGGSRYFNTGLTNADTSTAAGKMMKGCIGTRYDTGRASYVFENIPYLEYDVYVYFDAPESNNNDDNIGEYELTDLRTNEVELRYGHNSRTDSDGVGDYDSYDTFTGFKESTATSPSATEAELLGNYLVFRSRTSPDIRLRTDHVNSGANYPAVNGIQIVEVTPTIPRIHLYLNSVPDPVSENGAPFSYQAVLSTAPAEPVAVTIGLENDDLALDTYLLYFTPQNWNLPQSVTIYPLDNTDADGNRTVQITHTLSQGYNDDADDVILPVNLLDDDLSTVTVTGLEPEVLEPGSSVVTYRVQRSGGAQDTALAVAFSLGGTADNDGTDYSISGTGVVYDTQTGTGTLTLSANTVFQDIILSPVDDGLGEGPETVTCTLQANALYTVGTPGTASTTLLESITGFDLTQVFFPGAFDLNGKTITFTPTPSTDFYSAEVTNAAALPTSSDGHTEQVSGDLDNGFYTVALASRYLGVSYNTFYIGSNGYVTFDSGDTDSSWMAADHFSQLRISMFFADMLVVNGSTSIKTGRAGSGADARTVITVRNLKEKFDPETMDYQVELFDDDRLRLTWLNASVDESAIVGISGGLSSGGYSLPAYPTDLSALTPTTVNSPNTAPFFASSPRVALEQGLSYSSSVVTSDVDGDSLTLTAPTKPAWLTLTSTGSGTGTLSGTPSAAGSYPVVLEVDDGTAAPVQQSFTIEVYAALADQPPAIIENPSSLSIGYNEEARFRVIVSGNPTLQYQWYYEGNAIIDDGDHYSGATTYELTISNAVNAANGGTTSNPNGDEGSYYCEVSNAYGQATSSAATLTVGPPTAPGFDTQPTDQTINTGSTALFTVAVSGTTPITYQWQKDGVDLADGGDISGATTASLTVANVDNTDAGDYRVLATNIAATNQASSSGTLTVNTPPEITVDSPVGAVAHLVNLTDRLAMETTVTDDGLPGALTLTWNQVSGPGTASFEDASAGDTAVSFDQTGFYILRFTADDGLATDSVDVSVSVAVAAPNDPVVHYTFDEGSGSTATDSSSNNNDGSLNGPSWSTGQESGALSFDASNDRVVSTSGVAFTDAGGFTAAAWVYLDTSGTSRNILSQKNGTGLGRSLLYYNSDGSIGTYIGGAATYGDPFPVGEWVHVAVAAGGADIRLYINGEAAGGGSLPFEAADGALVVGSHKDENGSWWDGKIDDLQVFNRKLSTGEISAMLNGTENNAPVVGAGSDNSAMEGLAVTLAGTVNDDGLPASPGAVTTQWSLLSGPGSAIFSDETSLTSDVTFTGPGSFTLRLTADDGQAKTADDVVYTVSGGGLSPAEAWRDTYFNQTDNSGDAANDFDYDGDGVVNLLERAFGTNPTLNGSVELPTGGVAEDSGSDYLMITYRRLTGGTGTTGVDYTVDGMTYTVEYDADLTPPWSSGAVTQVGTASDNSDGTETVTVRLDTSAGSQTIQFIRIKVTEAP